MRRDLVLAVALGFAAGYLLWGWPTTTTKLIF